MNAQTVIVRGFDVARVRWRQHFLRRATLALFTTFVLGGAALAILVAPWQFAAHAQAPVLASNQDEQLQAQLAWQPIGLNISDVQSLAVHPSNASVMFAATNAGLYRTTDGGTNWTLVRALQTAPSGETLPYHYVSIHPLQPNVVFAAYGTGLNLRLVRSADNGTTWSQVTATGAYGAVFGNSSFTVNTIDYARSNANIVYLNLSPGYNSGYFVSRDGGLTFTQPDNLPFNPQAAHYLVTTPTSPSILYVFSGDDVWKSSDNGTTWTRAGAAPRGFYNTMYAAVGTSNPNVLYVGGTVPTASGAVYRTTDGGANWQLMLGAITRPDPTGNSAPAIVAVRGLVVDPANANTVYAAVASEKTYPATTFSEGIVRSTDGGATWTPLNSGLNVAQINPQDLVISSTGVLRVATTAGVYELRTAITGCTAPQITMQGRIAGACEGQSFTLRPTIQAGTTPLSYQWYRVVGGQRTPIQGATSESYTFEASADFSEVGVTVTNTCGSASASTVLTVATLNATATPTFFPAAGGNGTITRQYGNLDTTCTAGTITANVPWIIIGNAALGNTAGQSLIAFAVAANPGAARNGVITVRGAGTAARTINITQAGVGDTGIAQDVLWTNFVNTQVFGTVLRKVSGVADGSFDASAISQQTIAAGDGFMEFTVSGPIADRAAGLNALGNPATGDEIDHEVRLTGLGRAQFNEMGVYRGDTTYQVGDVFRVGIRNGRAVFSKNGVELATGQNAIIYPLKAVARFRTLGAEIANAKINIGTSPCTLPTIAQQPADVLVCPDVSSAGPISTFSYGVTAAGTAPFTYEWSEGGVVRKTTTTNATSDTYTFTRTGTEVFNSTVRVRVTNGCGAVVSREALARRKGYTITADKLTLAATGGEAGTVVVTPLTPLDVPVCRTFISSTPTGLLTITGPTVDAQGRTIYQYKFSSDNTSTTPRTAELRFVGTTFTITQAGTSGTSGTPINWTNLVNTQVVGNVLRKTGGADDGRWDGRALSTQRFGSGDFYLEFTATGPFAYHAIGLTTNFDTANNEPATIDYAIYFTNVDIAEFREKGVYRGDVRFKAGDVFRIGVANGKAQFYYNGVILAEGQNPVRTPLAAVAMFSRLGGEITDARFFHGQPQRQAVVRRDGPIVVAPCRDCDATTADDTTLELAPARAALPPTVPVFTWRWQPLTLLRPLVTLPTTAKAIKQQLPAHQRD